MAGYAVAEPRRGNPETEVPRNLNNVPYSSTLLVNSPLWFILGENNASFEQ
jgi:hypothetical protein